MTALSRLPEIAELDAPSALVRIPPDVNVPLTPRVRRLIDTAAFRRLARISQLGLVSLVYPAALHTRFEHSLGVYRLALRFLRRLSCDGRFAALIRREDAELLLCAALLHDIGHWPFCHPIEDIRLPGVPVHEQFAVRFIAEGEVAEVLRNDWGIEPASLLALLDEPAADARSRILSSILSGPIDIDKMDYLYRDSLHAGVPYGQHFDQQRLIGSLCLNEAGNGLAITDKGRTAAELMVFARYVMFSEVYWHHAVRAGTAMLQRAFYQLYASLDLDALFRLTEHALAAELLRAAAGGPAAELLDGLFGPTRRLYKRAAQYSYFQQPELYTKLARRPYPWLVGCAESLAGIISRMVRRRVAPHEMLIDAPPVELEVQFNVDIFFPKENCYRSLGEVSPVVDTLARKQFDDYVKRVRLFVHPSLADDLSRLDDLGPPLLEAIAAMEDGDH